MGLGDAWRPWTLDRRRHAKQGATVVWTGGLIPWVSPKDMKADHVGRAADRITKAAVRASATKVVPRRSILCVIRSGILQHTFPVALAQCRVTLNQDMRALTTFQGIVPRYVQLFLKLQNDRVLHDCSKDGTTVASISVDQLRQFAVPVAPHAEQLRIVEEAEALLLDVDDAEAAMNRARERMADYRASLLHAACTGALTAGWRDANPEPVEDGPALLRRILTERRAAWERDELARLTAAGKFPRGDGWKSKYSEPPGPTMPGVIELPTGWAWATLAQLGEFGRGKSRHRPRDDARLYGGDVPFIQTGDVSRSAGLIKTHTQTYSPLGLKQSKLWPAGTLCITIAANIAASGILGFSSCFPDSIVGLTPHFEELGKFAHYFIQAERERLDAFAPATAQKNINMEVLNNLIIPIPPQSEMQEIIARVEAAQEAIADGITTTSLGEMRQSILHAAFSGRLVPQDPADEPASTLLARLSADAARSTPRRRTTRAGARP